MWGATPTPFFGSFFLEQNINYGSAGGLNK